MFATKHACACFACVPKSKWSLVEGELLAPSLHPLDPSIGPLLYTIHASGRRRALL